MADNKKKNTTNKNDVKDNKDRMKIIKNLIDKGKKKGNLTYKEIMDELDNVELTPEQIEKVYGVLESMDIEVIGDMKEIETEEEEIDLRSEERRVGERV